VDYGSQWSADPIPGTSPDERWAVSPQKATGNATVDQSIIFKYYHEFQLKAFYGVRFGGSLPSQPTLVVFQGGLQSGIPLTNESYTYWADEGDTWTVNQSLLGSSSLERWWTSNATGIVTGAGTLEVIYLHQFLLTMIVDPSGSGSTAPLNGSENWENATSVVEIQANPAAGFVFRSWSCSGGGCIAQSQNPAQVTMNGPITETAQFSPVVIVTVQVEGTAVPQYVIVDSGLPTTVPPDFNWVPNSTHTLQALSNVSCGFNFMFFSGCVYKFTGWTVDGVSHNENPLILTADKPKTITATWSKDYFQLEILIAGVAAAVVVIVLLMLWSRKRIPKARPIGPLPSRRGPSGLLYRVGSLSDLGKSRSNNEDSILTMELLTTVGSQPNSAILSAVADGVGGSQKGEVASKLTLTTLAAQASRFLLDSEHADRSGLLRASIESANEEVVKYGMAHRESEGLASTIVASMIEGSTGYIANVGDSRAYLVNRGGIKQLSKDHSQVQELVDAGKISSDQARHYAGRNVITRAVGASTDIHVDTYTVSLSPGDRILLCTDGLWEPVSDVEIQKVVLQSPDPQAACEKLVALANERGGKDNVSLIIVELKGPMESNKP
jgi:protein phosphatase